MPPPIRLGFACDGQTCKEVPVPWGENSGFFWSGGIDLTGDGIAEIVRRQGEKIFIYEGGELSWQSPPDWRVVDLALGDPNDDGRGEVLIALNKPSPDGSGETSHPFVLGYRGGIYKILWGGSSVSDPILEVELGDLDGDGVQELVVLEESSVSMWRWHGWGFSLLWRSPKGNYQNLTLVTHEAEDGALIAVSKQENK
jgi:hypothetical protein